jgi:hypothetical protein
VQARVGTGLGRSHPHGFAYGHDLAVFAGRGLWFGGLGIVLSAGGTAVVEDPESAVVAGMPERDLARATGAFVERGERLAWLVGELVGSK